MRYFLLLPLTLTFCLLTHAQNPQYPPKSEAYLDPDLNQFVKDLLEAIESKNHFYLSSVMDVDVLASFGGDAGLAAFEEEWKPESSTSLMWPLMKRVIELGGVFLHDTADHTERYQFVFPYVYDMPLDVEDDYYSIGVITGKDVNLRTGPNTSSPVKSQLTYDVIWFLDGEEYGTTKSGTNPVGEPEWYLIETYDRTQRGWINWQYVYSPVSYRLFLFKNRENRWMISAFLAGD